MIATTQISTETPWLFKAAAGPKRTTPFRIGQWVKFKPLTSIAGAHTLPDGFVVGIYRPGREQGQASIKDKDGKPVSITPQFSHERVVVTTPEGNNLGYVAGDGSIHHALWFPPEACPQLTAAKREDIPATRLINVHPNWKPA